VRLAWVLLIAFALRLVVAIVWHDTVPYSDYFYYHEAGRLQANDAQFFFRAENFARYAKLAWWPPGYPWFLGVVYSIAGPSARAAVAVQVLLGTLVCGLVYAIGTRAVSRRTGILAALLIAVNPTYVFATNLLASENLAVVGMTLGLWWAARSTAPARSAVDAGIAFASAALVRAVCAGVAMVAALWILRSSRVRAAQLGAAFLLALAPWTLRNAIVAGSPAPVCFGGGLNFYFGHNAAPPGYRDLSETPFAGMRDPAAVDRLGWKLGLQHLGRDPLGVVTRSGHKLAALFAPSTEVLHALSAVRPPDGAPPGAGARIRTDRARDAFIRRPGTWLSALHTYVLLAGAIAAVAMWRTLPAELRLHALVAVYWIVVHLVFWAQPRFRYPMEIPMALLCAHAVTRWRSAR
jgi:4-amino-4-deoxy-L-arabinose transferase-like glycosyltransferase